MRIHHAFCALAVGAALALPAHAAPLVFNPFVSGTSLSTLLAGNNDTIGFAYAGDKFVGSVYSRTLTRARDLCPDAGRPRCARLDEPPQEAGCGALTLRQQPRFLASPVALLVAHVFALGRSRRPAGGTTRQMAGCIGCTAGRAASADR